MSKSGFDDITIKWDGQEYTVPADNVMGLIARVERKITLEELSHVNSSSRIPRAQLSEAFSAALNYAGAKVSTEQVYRKLFGAEGLTNILGTINMLMLMMIPPEHLRAPVNEVEAVDDSEAVPDTQKKSRKTAQPRKPTS